MYKNRAYYLAEEDIAMIDWEKDEEKRKNAIAFVEATQELIDTEGMEKVSIRKIAEKSGFHNSTIYLYFKDVDQLILLASLKHFNSYSRKLAELSGIIASPTDKFLAIWAAFGQTVFQNPLLFRNFFFGKYSGNLTSTIIQYYQLFPQERIHYSQDIEDMYYGNDIYDRCLKILQPLTEVESTRITPETLELANSIIVACLKQLLDQMCKCSDLDPDEVNDRLIQMICYTVGID